MKAFVEDFGVTVRQLREAHGWSQEQLAERSDLNRSYVGEVERGRVIPSIVTAQKLATALGINIVNLLACCEQLEQSRLAPRASRLAPRASRLAPRASRLAPRASRVGSTWRL